MRFLNVWRVIAIVLLLGGAFVDPTSDMPIVTAMADEGKDKSGQDDNGNNDKKEKNEDKEDRGKNNDKEDKGNKGKNDEDANGPAITSNAGYGVEVTCEYDDPGGTSTCTFTGIVPDGGKKINHMDVPGETVCADVIGGEYKEITSDPHTGVTGYQTKGSNDSVTLVLQGQVVPAGTATYWIKAASAILPVQGQGLDCDVDAAAFQLQVTPGSAVPTPAPTATPTTATGELQVFIYTCADVPADTTEFDWFRLCDSEGGVHELELAPISEVAVDPVLVDTDDSGDATFAGLDPGLYSLRMTGLTWCKAVSDNVDAEGNVIIEAGTRTTVYGFVCEGKPAT